MSKVEINIWTSRTTVKAGNPVFLWVAVINASPQPVYVLSLPPDGLGQNPLLPMKMRLLKKETKEIVPYTGPLFKVAVTAENFVRLQNRQFVGYQLDILNYYRLRAGSYLVQFWYDTKGALSRSINWGFPALANRLWRGRSEISEAVITIE
jgi:hypothetical protein